MRNVLMTVLAALLASPLCAAQDASRGVLMPFTVSGGVVVSDRARAADPDAARAVPGFRAVFYPSLKVDSHWFAYSRFASRISTVSMGSTPPTENYFLKVRRKKKYSFTGMSSLNEVLRHGWYLPSKSEL